MQSWSFISFNLNKRNYKISIIYVLTLIILIGAVLRFYRLDYQSLWLDEIHSMFGGDPDKSVSDIIEYSRSDQPPAYFLLLHSWFNFFAYNEFYGRLFSAVIGVIGIIVMFFLGKEVKDSRVGIIASLLTAVNYFHIYYSQEVRFYTFLFLVAALSYLFFIRCIKNSQWLNYAGYIFFTAVTVYTHYFGLVLIASQGIIFLSLIFLYKKDKKFIIYSICSAVIILILIAPWIPQFFRDSESSTFWIDQEQFPRFLVAFFYQYIKDPISFYICGILILYLMILVSADLFKKKEMPSVQLFVLFGWIVLGYGIPYAYSLIKMPMLISRYTIFILPAVLVVISVAIDMIKNSYLKLIIPVIIALSSVRYLVFIHDYYEIIYKQQFREIAKEVARENKTSSLMISNHAWHYNVYFKLINYKNQAVHPWDINLKEEVLKYDTVWVLQVTEDREPFEQEIANDKFSVIKELNLHGARATTYVRRKEDESPK